jgi:hypothetical protein
MQGLQGRGMSEEQAFAPASGEMFVQSRLAPPVPPLPEIAPAAPKLLDWFEPDSPRGACCPQPVATSRKSVTHGPDRFFMWHMA